MTENSGYDAAEPIEGDRSEYDVEADVSAEPGGMAVIEVDQFVVESIDDRTDDSMGPGDDPIDDPRVLAALERLADLDGLPVAEAVEVFTDVHARLNEALGASAQVDGDSGAQSSGEH